MVVALLHISDLQDYASAYNSRVESSHGLQLQFVKIPESLRVHVFFWGGGKEKELLKCLLHFRNSTPNPVHFY